MYDGGYCLFLMSFEPKSKINVEIVCWSVGTVLNFMIATANWFRFWASWTPLFLMSYHEWACIYETGKEL